MTTKLKLMPDYYCEPIWSSEPPFYIEIDTLPLSDDLKAALRSWSERFDAILNRDDPASSAFASAEESEAFTLDGKKLADELGKQLGVDYEVSYRPIIYAPR